MRKIPRNKIDRYLRRYYKAHDTEFQIRRFKETPPNIYGERLNKEYGEPITCHGYFVPSPTELRLQELGWSKEMTDFYLKVPFVLLVESGLANEDGTLNFSDDDLIEFPPLGLSYKISMIEFVPPFVGGVPTFIHIGGRKFTSGKTSL